MNSIETLATFLGCTAINVGVLLLFVLTFSVFHEVFASISAKMFGITREEAAVLLLFVLTFSVFHEVFASISAKMFGITREEPPVRGRASARSLALSGRYLLPRVSAIPTRAGDPEHCTLYRPEDHVLIPTPTRLSGQGCLFLRRFAWVFGRATDAVRPARAGDRRGAGGTAPDATEGFADEWNSPEMASYDDYDVAKDAL